MVLAHCPTAQGSCGSQSQCRGVRAGPPGTACRSPWAAGGAGPGSLGTTGFRALPGRAFDTASWKVCGGLRAGPDLGGLRVWSPAEKVRRCTALVPPSAGEGPPSAWMGRRWGKAMGTGQPELGRPGRGLQSRGGVGEGPGPTQAPESQASYQGSVSVCTPCRISYGCTPCSCS